MSLKIQGEGQTPQEQRQAQRDFVDRMRRCSGLDLRLGNDGSVTEGTTLGQAPTGSAPTAEAIRDMISNGRQLVIRVRKGPRRGDPIIDGYCLRRVILDHIDAFSEQPPAAHPSATTRCEVLAHVLADTPRRCAMARLSVRRDSTEITRRVSMPNQSPRHRPEGAAAPQHDRGTRRAQGRDLRALRWEHYGRGTGRCDGRLSASLTRPRERRRRKKKTVEGAEVAQAPGAALCGSSFRPCRHGGGLGTPPADWTNFGTAHQAVSYGEVEWLKGEARAGSVLVHHLLPGRDADRATPATGTRQAALRSWPAPACLRFVGG